MDRVLSCNIDIKGIVETLLHTPHFAARILPADPTWTNMFQRALLHASGVHMVRVVQHICQVGLVRLDLNLADGAVMRSAIRGGHVEIVKLLLYCR
jgi:hypothetical protein